MKTGQSYNKRDLPDTFCIPLLGFDALLKRCGFKDSVLFINHNPLYKMDEHIYASGVCFNLFSEYGIGKKLEPLIKELLKNQVIDPDKNEDNIYFQEIVNMANTIKLIISDEDSNKENEWTYDYAIKSISKIDKISSDRFIRLFPLFEDISDLVELPFEIIDEIKPEFCNCGFCIEFRKFNEPKDKHIDRIILNTVLNIC